MEEIKIITKKKKKVGKFKRNINKAKKENIEPRKNAPFSNIFDYESVEF